MTEAPPTDMLDLLNRGKARRAVRRTDAHTAAAEVPDPFAPQPIDPATVTGTPAERLAAFEAAMDEASDTAGRSLRAAKARFAIEAGTALRAIQKDTLYTEKGFTSFEAYVSERWKMTRARAYQLIEAAPAMLAVSNFFDTPPVESQAMALAPVIRDHGEDAARQVVAAAKQTAGKVTAATLKTVGRALGFVPAPQTQQQTSTGDESGKEGTGEDPAVLEGLRAIGVLSQALDQQRRIYDSLGDGVIAAAQLAEPTRAEHLLREIRQYANRTAHRVRLAPADGE